MSGSVEAIDATFAGRVRQTDLRAFVNAAHSVVDEAILHFGPTGLWIRAVDPANVAIIEPRLEADGFENITEESGIVGINLDYMDELLDGLVTRRWVDIEIRDVDRELVLDAGPVSVSVPTIDPDTVRSEPDLPELDLPVQVELAGVTLDWIVDLANQNAEKLCVAYSMDDQEVAFATVDGRTEVTVTLGDDRLESVAVTDDAHSDVSLDYLVDAVEPIPSQETATLRLGTEFPVELSYRPSEHVEVLYGQAPLLGVHEDE